MRFSVVWLVAIVVSMAAFAQEARDYTRDPSSAPLLEWRLDAGWFGAESSSEFRYVGQINHYTQTVMWVRPGFELRGKRVRFAAWDAPQLLATRSGRDAKAAVKFVATFPPLLRETLSTKLNPPVVPVQDDAEAEILFLGRVVDCTAMIWFVYVPLYDATVTVDMKVLDARTGELLAAIRNRRVGIRQASELAKELVNLSEQGFQAAYARRGPGGKR